MIAVIQRVTRAAVRIGPELFSKIDGGLLVLAAVVKGDTDADAAALAKKIVELRIFEDAEGKMNRSIQETGGAILAVSQFTLAGDTRRGRRPSFDQAARPDDARPLFQRFVDEIGALGVAVATGQFQAMMEVELVNNGPVTFILSTRKNDMISV